MTTKSYPTENLVRGWDGGQTVVRAADNGEQGRVLVGEFARFNEWTEIYSVFEGEFLERIAPGAFDRTIARDLSRVKVLYDHGHDPNLGNKPLGPIRSVEATDTGMRYEVDLIDTDYNRDFIVPAAEAGLLGASFRMAVRGNDWYDPEEPTDHNPRMLPERTITDIDLYEFGPVTFPAYEGATAGLRSRSDEFLSHLMNEPEFLTRFIERTNTAVAARVLEDARATQIEGSANGQPDNQGSANGQPATNGRSYQAALAEITKLRKR